MRALPADQRLELLRLAKRGERHPDPAVAAVAHRWSHGPDRHRWWNRVPGWLLPLAAALVATAGIVCGVVDLIPMPLALVLAAVDLVPLCGGLLAWNSMAAARALRALYPAA
jgi:hypothetical protein